MQAEENASNAVDHMSITHSARRINAIAQKIGAQTYLEIGVENGHTFMNVTIPKKVGVDPHLLIDHAAYQHGPVVLHKITSDEYFSAPRDRVDFDVVFIDGFHTFEQALRDFVSVLSMTHNSSVILVDDVIPSDVYSSLKTPEAALGHRRRAGGDGLAWHGDVFKLVFFVHDFMPTFSFATTANGQMLVWRQPRATFRPIINSIEHISRMTYFDMLERINIMNIVQEEDVILLQIPCQ